jgi:hypothetical protein
MRARVLPDLAHSALRILRQDGPGRLALIAFRLGVSPLLEFGRLVFFARELDDGPTGVEAPAGIEIRLAAVTDISQLVSAGRPDPRLASERFARGDRCVIAVDGAGAVPHSRWVTSIPTPIPELRMSIRPRPGEAYFYDGYTRPEARGGGLDGVVRRSIFDMLRADRCRRVYSYVRGDNKPGLRAAARWQACVGELWFLRIRGCPAWVLRKRAASERDHASPSPWPDLG